jgi:hypothetical protein
MSTTPIANMVAKMLAAGDRPEAIVLAIQTIETVVSTNLRGFSAEKVEKVEVRRERDRLRKRKEYEQRKRDLARTTEDAPEANDAGARSEITSEFSADSPRRFAEKRCNFLSLESRLSRKKEKEEQKVSTEYIYRPRVAKSPRSGAEKGTAVTAADKRKGTRIAPDWCPSESDRDFARKHGLTDQRIDALAAEFRDYWIDVPGQRGCKLGWSETWRNRIRKVTSDGYGTHQNRTYSASRSPQTHGDAVIAGMARVARRRFGGEPPDRGRDVSERPDPAGGPYADRAAADRDQAPHRQLDLIAVPDPGDQRRSRGGNDGRRG